ncbi:MAG TPA: hypothetical protein VED37_14195 [Ktedonobacteraceae bacterium]|nr:hypothetical protein [Ktedonobacteraceae bacterium]
MGFTYIEALFEANFIIYLIIAAIVGFLAEFIVGWRLPFGFIGAIIAALIGIWLMTQVIVISGLGELSCVILSEAKNDRRG